MNSQKLNLKDIFVELPISLKSAMNIINKNCLHIVFFVDSNMALIGSLSDGDIRRAILNGTSIGEVITVQSNIFNKKPVFLNTDASLNSYWEVFNNDITCIPLVDSNNKVIDFSTPDLVRRFPISTLDIGELEKTNEPYAIAKIAGLKLVDAYRRQYEHTWISAMPTNLYGPRDNFDLNTAHVLPALLHRFHNAKIANSPEVKIWGDGTALREFLHVEDLGRACLLLIDAYDSSTAINIGSGEEVSIRYLATLISKIVGFQGELSFDSNLPNGTPRKFLDSSLISQIGWKPQISLENGISLTYDWFIAHHTKELNR